MAAKDNGKRSFDQSDTSSKQTPSKRQKKRNAGSSAVGTTLNIFGKDAWDDSELIAAWDRGVEEYRRHHSNQIILDDLSTASPQHTVSDGGGPTAAHLDGEDGEIEDTPIAQSTAQFNVARSAAQPNNAQTAAHTTFTDVSTHKGPAHETAPQTNANTKGAKSPTANPATLEAHSWPEYPFTDPSTTHLVMSWYWAGYYTGLHQGRSSQ